VFKHQLGRRPPSSGLDGPEADPGHPVSGKPLARATGADARCPARAGKRTRVSDDGARHLRDRPPGRGRVRGLLGGDHREVRQRLGETVCNGLYSVVPDVLLLTIGLLHATRMDVFALHITAQFLWPSALVAALVLWTLAVGGCVAAVVGASRTAAAARTASLAFLALALRAPMPSTLQESREQSQSQVALRALLADAAYLCSFTAAPQVPPDDKADHTGS